MGVNQSSDNGNSHFNPTLPGGEVKTGYYELLGIDDKASEDEIKKAYRKKALELHPDRNYENVEAATKQFAVVQSAYEILSDPQERAWYDSHRDSILRGGDNNAEHYEHNIRITTADDIMQLFSKFNHRIDFSDSPTGFFGALRELFDNLIREEEAACEWNGLDPISYPSFGCKGDDHEVMVRPFYAAWSGFATRKTFSWKDIYNYSEAPDRQIRRMMEKENRRLRDEAVREFNDVVRSLVAFVRKRDPRFKPNKQSEEERQKVFKDAAIAQAVRSRAANQAKIMEEAVPDWMRANANGAGDLTDDDWPEVSPLKEDIECVVCRKTFRSEKQYEAHENSKKHIKAVAQIRRQMQREDREMDLGMQEKVQHSPKELSTDAEDSLSRQKEDPLEYPHAEIHYISREQSAETAKFLNEDAQKSQGQEAAPSGSESSVVSNEEHALGKDVEQFLAPCGSNLEQISALQGGGAELTMDALVQEFADNSLLDNAETTRNPKLGKAKERRAKKAAQQPSSGNALRAEFICARCSEGFISKNQLFRHIKASEHDYPVPKATRGGKGKSQ